MHFFLHILKLEILKFKNLTLKFSIDKMDDSRKLHAENERQIIPNFERLSGCKEKRSSDKKTNQIAIERCSKPTLAVPNRYAILY